MKLINARGDPESYRRLYAEADRHAVLGPYQLAAGIFRHPRSGLWQVWSSTTGVEVSWLAAYRDQARAEQAAQDYRAFCMTEAVYDPEACAAFFEQLLRSADAEAENVSGVDVANIVARIHEAVFECYKGDEHA